MQRIQRRKRGKPSVCAKETKRPRRSEPSSSSLVATPASPPPPPVPPLPTLVTIGDAAIAEKWDEVADVWEVRTEDEKKHLLQASEQRKRLFDPFVRDFHIIQSETNLSSSQRQFDKTNKASAPAISLHREQEEEDGEETGREYDSFCGGHWLRDHHYRVCGTLWPKGCVGCMGFVKQLPGLFLNPVGARYCSNLVRVQRVGKDCLPACLEGQWEVVAKHDVELGTVLGVYEGYTFRKSNQPDWISPDSCYGLDVELWREGKKYTHCIEALRPVGNGAMERINDYRVDTSVSGDLAPNDPNEQNCRWITVFRDGEPFEITYTVKPVKKDKPFKHDYSDTFWKTRVVNNKPSASTSSSSTSSFTSSSTSSLLSPPTTTAIGATIPPKPRRPSSAFGWYFKENFTTFYRKLKGKHSNSNANNISSNISGGTSKAVAMTLFRQVWKTDDRKSTYQRLAEDDRLRYDTELALWKQTFQPKTTEMPIDIDIHVS